MSSKTQSLLGAMVCTLAVAWGCRDSSTEPADLSGDGHPDLTVANFSSDTVSVMLSTCLA